MKLDKISIDGKKDSIEVLDKIFSAKINHKLVSAVLYKTNANYKGRHAKTKQQNEVKGPTSKIYAQKGTGGARHASRKAPIFVGGGIAHGPKGELAYKKRKLNKTEKKQSIASLISEKNKNKNLLILSDFNTAIKKTKEMNLIIKKFEISNSLIIRSKCFGKKSSINADPLSVKLIIIDLLSDGFGVLFTQLFLQRLSITIVMLPPLFNKRAPSSR